MLETKLAALEALREHDIRCTLVCTVDHNTNLHEVGAVLRFGLERPAVRGVSFQLATYCGRHLDPRDLEQRATMPDLVKGTRRPDRRPGRRERFLSAAVRPSQLPHDVLPLPRRRRAGADQSRIIDVRKHMDLIANSVVYTPARARQLVASTWKAPAAAAAGPAAAARPTRALDEFVVKALAEKLTGTEVFRITLTAFLDVHNFDTRRVMKCCLAHLLPSGHVVPFCAYNTLYRDGHVPLPPL